MRLIDTTTLQLVHRRHEPSLKYAILSHRWSERQGWEVSFDDLISGDAKRKPGFFKIKHAAARAREHGFDWLWVDTCCIDKKSSAELTESINSMYIWYRDSARCYAYLQDIEHGGNLGVVRSEWFSRGWTLQELLAPTDVQFYDKTWRYLGDKYSHRLRISTATGIDDRALRAGGVQESSIAEKISWAAKRKTTYTEDLAYCLVGLFDVGLTPIYGEGERSFLRLQEEIMKRDDDHSIFAWAMSTDLRISGMLAPRPSCFRDLQVKSAYSQKGSEPHSLTNRGLSIYLEITPWMVDTYLAFLECSMTKHGLGYHSVGIFLRRLDKDDQFIRVNVDHPGGLFWDEYGRIRSECHQSDDGYQRLLAKRHLYVRDFIPVGESIDPGAERTEGFHIPSNWGCDLPTPDPKSPQFCHLYVRQHPDFEVLDLSPDLGFSQIALGFSFEFEPLCLLSDLDQTYDFQHIFKEFSHCNYYDEFDNDNCVKTEDGCHELMCPENHDGIWRLRGDRRTGLTILLLRSPEDTGTWLSIWRTKQKPISWTVSISEDVIEDIQDNVPESTKKRFHDSRSGGRLAWRNNVRSSG